MREELKYVVPEAALDDIRREIQPFMELDKFGLGYEERGYTIRSIYLDSPDLLFYHEKQNHLQNRKKLRIRGYNDRNGGDMVFLEIKRKFSSAIAKDRAFMAYDDLEELFQTLDIDRLVDQENRFPESREAARSFFYHVYKLNLRPANLVVYEREAFMGRFDPTLRITFDRNLRGGVYPRMEELFEERDFQHVMPGYFILELKYSTQFPGWLRPTLARHGLMQRSASKYCMVIDVFNRRKEGRIATLANMQSLSKGPREMPPGATGDGEQRTPSSVILTRSR
jgi:hypothetical protein